MCICCFIIEVINHCTFGTKFIWLWLYKSCCLNKDRFFEILMHFLPLSRLILHSAITFQ